MTLLAIDNKEKIEETQQDFENYAPEFEDAQPPFATKACLNLPVEKLRVEKRNVLPPLVSQGNRNYTKEYEAEIIETTVERLMTHEPCIEHENLGGQEEMLAEYLKYRNLQGNGRDFESSKST